jgi:hypothetical protein
MDTSASTIQGPVPILQSTMLSTTSSAQKQQNGQGQANYQEQFERNSSNEYSNNNLQYDDSSIVGSATDL